MKKILLLILFFIPQYTFASVSDYINSFSGDNVPNSYYSFQQIVKGQATVSDIDKQSILDKEVSNELNSNFIYTDLENCIKIALEKNYEIKVQDFYREQAYWSYRNSQFQLLPNIFYNYNMANLGGQFLIGGILATTIHEVTLQSAVGAEWSTINQGRYFFLMAQNKNILKSTEANLELKKEEIIRDTVIAYYDVLEKKLEIDVQKTNLYDRLEQLKYTNARFEAGIGTLYDVKRAQAELAGAQQDYSETLNLLRLKQGILANILGVEILDAIYPFEITVDRRELINPNFDIEKLYEQALVSREDIRAKIAEVDAYRAQRSSNYTDFIPDIVISYQNGHVGTVRRGVRPNNSIMLDVRVPVGKNLLMGTITQLKADNALVEAKKLELIELKRNVKESILSSYFDSINALKKIDASKIEVEAANVSLDLSLANMKAGEATFIDVIASQNLKVQSNINLIKNMIEYNRAQTNLLFNIGLISPKNVLRGYKRKFY